MDFREELDNGAGGHYDTRKRISECASDTDSQHSGRRVLHACPANVHIEMPFCELEECSSHNDREALTDFLRKKMAR